jgi:hypothetical protein
MHLEACGKVVVEGLSAKQERVDLLRVGGGGAGSPP